jgi:hypothetical protein
LCPESWKLHGIFSASQTEDDFHNRRLPMAVIAIFKYQVKPGRMDDFLAKSKQAMDPQFVSKVMPKSIRMFRSTVPGPDTGPIILMIEYEDMAAYGARTAFENSTPAWKSLFEAKPDSPETLLSVELLTEC